MLKAENFSPSLNMMDKGLRFSKEGSEDLGISILKMRLCNIQIIIFFESQGRKRK
jgi:hypothetical protein